MEDHRSQPGKAQLAFDLPLGKVHPGIRPSKKIRMMTDRPTRTLYRSVCIPADGGGGAGNCNGRKVALPEGLVTPSELQHGPPRGLLFN